MSNICGSFISSMPVTGSMARCAINYASGVQTTLGGLFTGSLVIIALAYFIEIFRYIPKSVLAAILMTANLHMVDIEGTITIWKSRRKKRTFLTTFLPFYLKSAYFYRN